MIFDGQDMHLGEPAIDAHEAQVGVENRQAGGRPGEEGIQWCFGGGLIGRRLHGIDDIENAVQRFDLPAVVSLREDRVPHPARGAVEAADLVAIVADPAVLGEQAAALGEHRRINDQILGAILPQLLYGFGPEDAQQRRVGVDDVALGGDDVDSLLNAGNEVAKRAAVLEAEPRAFGLHVRSPGGS